MTHNIQSWLHEARKSGMQDKDIKNELKNGGWTEEQIKKVLAGQSKNLSKKQYQEIAHLMNDPAIAHSSGKKVWVSAIAVLAVIAVGILYFIGSYYGFPWQENTNSTNNTNKTQYTSTTAKTISEQLAAQSDIKKFGDYDELWNFIENNTATSRYGGYDYGLGMKSWDADSFGLAEEALPATDFGLGVADLKTNVVDYSTTNIQVAGVDEADIIKTDGEYIYAVSKQNVFIIRAYPAGNAEIISTIALESTPQNIYLNGKNLVIYGQDTYIASRPFYDAIRPSSSYTFFKVFDIKDKENPIQIRDLTFEGNYNNSRMIGDYVYFVTTQPSYSILEDHPIPMVVENDEVLPIDPNTKGCNCPDVYYIDAPYQNYTYTSVSAINVAENDQPISNELYLLSSGENMYVSQNNIYIVYTKYISEYQLMLEATKEILIQKLSVRDQQKVRDIEAAPSHILSENEKFSKISYIFERYTSSLNYEEQDALEEQMALKVQEIYDDISKEMEKTVIHKISIDEDKLAFETSGEVTGHVLNQFSMDEQDGYFRIATTKSQAWLSIDSEGTSESYSNVYVLDKNLKTVGALENLAEGEQIYSARFMGKRVYLVTFRQTDPLYAIDLGDPKNPKVLGELKIPGFSSYLHPYDETTIIGFGKQATDTGRVQGLKLSLFDVTDVDNLREIDTYEMGDSGSDSIALDDHKAFLFSKDKNLLVVPVTLREQNTIGRYTSSYKHGAMIFNITKDGFTFRERLDHSDGTADDENSEYFYGYYYYDTSVKRSMYIEDTLYTVSNKYLKINSLGDLSEVNSITLVPGNAETDFTIIP